MKKTIYLILTLTLALTACNKATNTNANNEDKKVNTSDTKVITDDKKKEEKKENKKENTSLNKTKKENNTTTTKSNNKSQVSTKDTKETKVSTSDNNNSVVTTNVNNTPKLENTKKEVVNTNVYTVEPSSPKPAEATKEETIKEEVVTENTNYQRTSKVIHISDYPNGYSSDEPFDVIRPDGYGASGIYWFSAPEDFYGTDDYGSSGSFDTVQKVVTTSTGERIPMGPVIYLNGMTYEEVRQEVNARVEERHRQLGISPMSDDEAKADCESRGGTWLGFGCQGGGLRPENSGN